MQDLDRERERLPSDRNVMRLWRFEQLSGQRGEAEAGHDELELEVAVLPIGVQTSSCCGLLFERRGDEPESLKRWLRSGISTLESASAIIFAYSQLESRPLHNFC